MNIKDRSIQCAKAVMPEQWLSATRLPALKNKPFRVSWKRLLSRAENNATIFQNKKAKTLYRKWATPRILMSHSLMTKQMPPLSLIIVQQTFATSHRRPRCRGKWEERSDVLLQSAWCDQDLWARARARTHPPTHAREWPNKPARGGSSW